MARRKFDLEEITRAAVQLISFKKITTDSQSNDSDIAIHLGDGRYQVGREIVCLDGSKSLVLQALVELRGANLAALKKQSGVLNPSATLKSIHARHPLLAPFIVLPGGKGQGGYSTTIVNGTNKQSVTNR